MPMHTSLSWQNLPLPGSGTALSITPIAGMHPRKTGGFPAPSVIQVGRETQNRASTAGQGVHTRQQAKQTPAPPTHPLSVLLTQEAWCEWLARVDSLGRAGAVEGPQLGHKPLLLGAGRRSGLCCVHLNCSASH